MQIEDYDEVRKWIGGIRNKGTESAYLCALRRYVEYTSKNPTELIDEAIEDMRKDPRKRMDIVKNTLVKFYEWLLKEAPKKQATGAGKNITIVGKGLSPKLSTMFVMAVRSFYGVYDITIRMKGVSKLPKPKIQHPRKILNNLDIKRLVEHCTSLRDRAMILVMFQSGMDEATLCGLRYSDISEGLQKDSCPLVLTLRRDKTGTDYCTFIGRDAINSLKAYLAELKRKDILHDPDTPLFLKESQKARSREGMTTNLIEIMMKDVATKAGFTNGDGFNNCGSHALRESFGSILTTKGIPNSVVDFLLGHAIGDMAKAYMTVQLEDLKKTYAANEKYLSIYSAERSDSDSRIEVLEKELADLKTAMGRLTQIKPEYLQEAYQKTVEEESLPEPNGKPRKKGKKSK